MERDHCSEGGGKEKKIKEGGRVDDEEFQETYLFGLEEGKQGSAAGKIGQ